MVAVRYGASELISVLQLFTRLEERHCILAQLFDVVL